MALSEILVKAIEAKAKETVAKIQDTAKPISETGIKEYAKNEIENIKQSGDAVISKLETIKNMSPEQLAEQLKENISKAQESIAESNNLSCRGCTEGS